MYPLYKSIQVLCSESVRKTFSAVIVNIISYLISYSNAQQYVYMHLYNLSKTSVRGLGSSIQEVQTQYVNIGHIHVHTNCVLIPEMLAGSCLKESLSTTTKLIYCTHQQQNVLHSLSHLWGTTYMYRISLNRTVSVLCVLFRNGTIRGWTLFKTECVNCC